MTKGRSIARSSIAILAAMGFMVAWSQSRFTHAAESKAESPKLVRLKITFADGQWAKVSQFVGGTIRIEEKGSTLGLTPYLIGKDGRVELKVLRIAGPSGDQTAQTLSVAESPIRLDAGGVSLSVQIVGTGEMSQAAQLTKQCCTRDCEGRLICGVCVCTPCGVCAAYNWCDCPAPGPIGEE